jgi:Outer membrane protein beta-barrel domain
MTWAAWVAWAAWACKPWLICQHEGPLCGPFLLVHNKHLILRCQTATATGDRVFPYEESQRDVRDLKPSTNGWSIISREIMMKKFLLATALTAACGVAAAQGYAGALIGMGKLSTECAVSCDKSDTAFKAFVGYEVAPGWAIEGSYYSLGKYVVDADEVKLTAFGVGGAYRFDLAADLKGVARLGFAQVKVKGGDSDTRPYLGLGAEFALGDGITISGNWDMVTFPDSDKVNVFGVGAQIGF